MAAQCSELRFMASMTCGLAPLSSRNLHVSIDPEPKARCKAVLPCAPGASTSAPSARASLQASTSASRAALCSGPSTGMARNQPHLWRAGSRLFPRLPTRRPGAKLVPR